MRFGSLLMVVVTTLALAASPVAAQDERDRARAEFQRGVDAYSRNEYQTALEAFQEAYRIAPHPSVRVNIANCYEQLQRPLEALFHFEHFLQEAQRPAAAQRREIDAAIRRLQQLVGTLSFQVTPDGAVVTIDGTDTRRAPVHEPVRVIAGRHQVDVSLAGFQSERQQVDVTGGQTVRVAIRLRRGDAATASATTASASSSASETSTASAATSSSASTQASSSASTAASTTASSSTASSSSASTTASASAGASADDTASASAAPTGGGSSASSSDDHGGGLAAPHDEGGVEVAGLRITTPVWIAGGVTAAALVGAAITGGLALSANGTFDARAATYADPSQSAAAREQARLEGLSAASDARTLAAVTDGLFVTAILGAGATTFLLITTQEGGMLADEEAPATAMVVPVLSADQAGLSVAGAF